MADARVVTNYLVELAENDQNTLRPMAVLKLVYIAHGYSLGVRGIPLIPNHVEAWKFGLVIPDLYHDIKYKRDKPVSKLVVSGLEDFGDGDKELINAVYQAYKDQNGIRLSNLTHQRGTPWAQVYRPNVASIRISDDLIQNHYQSLLAS